MPVILWLCLMIKSFIKIKRKLRQIIIYLARIPARIWDTFAEPNNYNNAE